jgi:CMP-N,N'-diacetyllegionaminic acid synthase
MADIIAIIPARSGSKGVVDKNVKLLNGHPLISYSIRAACLTAGITRVVVSTDSEKYASIARKYGAETPFLRPSELAEDQSVDIEWINHALEWFKSEEGFVPRLIVHLRPTTPLRHPAIIEEAIKKFESNDEATALRSVHEMSQPAYKCFEIDNEYLACLCTQNRDIENTTLGRQGFPKTYEPNGYVDVLKTDFILTRQKMHGDRVMAFQTPRVADIDSQEDFDYLLYQVMQNDDLFKKYFDSMNTTS